MIIGVTGAMGSGKSFVARELAKKLDVKCISADWLCRELLEIGQAGYEEIRNHCPPAFFLDDGKLNRGVLRRAIFSDDRLRAQVDSFLHPLVRSEILQKCKIARNQNSHLVVEVPLLFEKSWQDDFDIVGVVYADSTTCIQRIVGRDNVSNREAQESQASQMSIEAKCVLGDRVIDNSGSFADTLMQIDQFIDKITANPVKNTSAGCVT